MTQPIAVILSENDLEAQDIIRLAEGRARIIRIDGPWRSRLSLGDERLNCEFLPETVVLCELPDPAFEDTLRAAGKRVHVIDHHLSIAPSGEILDRRTPARHWSRSPVCSNMC